MAERPMIRCILLVEDGYWLTDCGTGRCLSRSEINTPLTCYVREGPPMRFRQREVRRWMLLDILLKDKNEGQEK